MKAKKISFNKRKDPVDGDPGVDSSVKGKSQTGGKTWLLFFAQFFPPAWDFSLHPLSAPRSPMMDRL